MAKTRKIVNPFYVLLVIVGVAFLISACAYGVMAFRDTSLAAAGQPMQSQGLLGFMDQHGMIVLGGEVLLLGLFTIGAIGTDEFWQRRQSASRLPVEQEQNETTLVSETSRDHGHES